MNINPTVRPVKFSDKERIFQLLQSLRLPLEGIEEHLRNFLVMEINQKIFGVVGLEIYENKGLLRSLGVNYEVQGNSYGKLLCKEILEKAKQLNLDEIYLLTETAEDFFSKQGFEKISRKIVSDRVKESVEFKSVCPQSAVCMHKLL
ncbi:MAG: hypothetical protein A2V66_00425 [Ignavibacteria bacterium RBG_13_36_8]|nr:MAG: hypothetical protein A2V66_00425 [Ignavibacteria bacterium RBG_13_36_8]